MVSTMVNSRTPRVQITLKPATRAIFARLSAAQERPEATIIAEFLDETAPALQNVVAVVERAKNIVSRVGQQERERFAVAESELLQLVHESEAKLHQADAVMGQLSLELGKRDGGTGERFRASPVRSRERHPDPPDTNRGVNTRKRNTGTRSAK
jgi:hypothetical protein